MNGIFFINSMQVCNVLYLAYMESVSVANLKEWDVSTNHRDTTCSIYSFCQSYSDLLLIFFNKISACFKETNPENILVRW